MYFTVDGVVYQELELGLFSLCDCNLYAETFEFESFPPVLLVFNPDAIVNIMPLYTGVLYTTVNVSTLR